MAKFDTVEAYLASLPEATGAVARAVRDTIRAAAPGSDETIRYDMPAAMVDGHYLIQYAAWKTHMGLYPVPVFDGPLEDRIAPYRSGKDTVRFPLRQPIPHDLVADLVAHLVARRPADDR